MTFSIRAALFVGALVAASQSAFAETVTLEQAITKAAEAAPLLKADDAAVAGARAGRVQAGVRPNPSVTVEAENFVGTGPYDVLGRAEITATYNQPIERGGKRAARVALADKDIDVAQATAGVTRLDLAASVQRAFFDVLIAKDVLQISQFRLATERELQTEALRRVRGYKDPLFVETRAAARVASARIGVEQAEYRMEASRDLLAGYWGGDGEDLTVDGALMASDSVPLKLAPSDEKLIEARVARAGAAVVVEETKRTQDYTVNGGTRFLRETNDVAAVVGITIPIGRFDRNQGGIDRARAEKDRLSFAAEAARLEKLRRLASLRANAESAQVRADALMDEVYPRAYKTLQQVREGYNRGGFTFRDIQDAADAILEVQDQWLEANTQYRDLQTEIDRLTGRFDPASSMETNP
ncbi:TolC family protein [Sphingorhabdus sp.]|uniref:TolC family protein n=1 Tax=Sphingorhabdus sp. TaxID=1902408 RepID=UPI002FDB4971